MKSQKHKLKLLNSICVHESKHGTKIRRLISTSTCLIFVLVFSILKIPVHIPDATKAEELKLTEYIIHLDNGKLQPFTVKKNKKKT